MNAPRVLFAGTPGFARASLAALVDAGIRPVAVLTQPDRPSGRGRKLVPGPVKTFAVDNGIEVRQPKTLRDADEQAALRELEPDVLVVAAYGLILPQAVLDIPRHGCLNVHASILPRWRGAAPIQAAILHGDTTTGISLMQMEAGLDTGPVFATAEIEIRERETAGELHDRLALLGGELLAERFADIVDGRLEANPQDDSLATYAGKISRADAEIDWSNTATHIDRQIRAFNPVPGAWTTAGGEAIKIWDARPLDNAGAHAGEVLSFGAAGLVVGCGEGALAIDVVQRPGKRRVSAAEYAGQEGVALAQVTFGSS